MSKMLGRSRPWGQSSGCCGKHDGPNNLVMGPKRQKEKRDWRKEVAKEDEPDRRAGPVC